MLCGLDRSWSRDAPTQPPSSPALLYSLAHLEDQLKAAYKLVTEGKFSDALRVFVRMLQVRRDLLLYLQVGWRAQHVCACRQWRSIPAVFMHATQQLHCHCCKLLETRQCS
jgi:hypothetical protein